MPSPNREPNPDRHQVAVKRVNASEEEAADEVAREIRFWSRLCEPLAGGGCHPHIVQLLGHGPRDKAGFVHLVMEYCAGGHLWQEVERRQRKAGGAAAGGACFSEREAAATRTSCSCWGTGRGTRRASSTW